MSWLNLGNKDKKNEDSDNGIIGLTYLEKFTEAIQYPKKLKEFEWRRKLKSTSGNSKFKIKYYGTLHDTYKSIIVATNFAPQKIVAVDILSNEEVLLFDGCIHGYDAMTWVEFSTDQIEKRRLEHLYKDEKGNEVFEIELSAYYQIDYESEYKSEVDENGKIEIKNGVKIEFEELKRNGCDYFQIIGINESGDRIEILSEELS